MSHTFYWHDYETFGAQARRDRPAQFAGIRTDAELNEIGEPLMVYCKPAPDFLPDPQSCLITGITPQICLERGVPEHEFAARIERELAQNETIGVGYNTIRFDDEVTRFLFWRNLIDPYAREWQNGCGRWDILDMVRTAFALRPEGIEWPTHEDGRASFRLEQLTAANGLAHDAAHDALSDVRATISLARLIRQRQPKLFDFCFSLHKKDKAAEEVGMPGQRPFLHVSGMIPVERGCTALMWPIAMHPANKNEILCWDLAFDPAELESLDAETMRARLFSKSSELPEGVERLPIKSVHLNKSPIAIANYKPYLPVLERRWQFDAALAMKHAERAGRLRDLAPLWREVFQRPNEAAPDVDEDLYGGFVGNGDRRLLTQLRKMAPAQLAKANPAFDDARLEEIVFRYRARNFPSSLNTEERQEWEEWRAARLIAGAGGARSAQQMFDEIDGLQENADERGEEILGALYEYAEMIVPS
ncbi:MAG TPA: exodeoxyribonuclease I [Burkholderiaceae bacterium]